MKFKSLLFVALLSFAAAALVFTQDPAKKDSTAKPTTMKADSTKAAMMYTCSMHPEILSDKPGKCPKCGMDLVPVKAAGEGMRGRRPGGPGGPREKLDKGKLVEDGKYHCCIRPSCDACANMGHACDCYNDVKKGEKVCRECYAGWQDGKGAVPGISKDSVKTSPPRTKN